MRIQSMVIAAAAAAALVVPAAAASAATGTLPAAWKCKPKTTTTYGDVLDCRGVVAVRAGKNPARSQWAKNEAIRAIEAQATAAGVTLRTTPYPGCTWVKKDRWKCSAFWYADVPAAHVAS